MSERFLIVRKAANGFHVFAGSHAEFGESNLYNQTRLNQVYKDEEVEKMFQDIRIHFGIPSG